MYRVLRNSRIPLFLHRKSNHVFTMWQHLILLAIRQYEGKSYRMFIEWLVEAYYLRLFLGLSRIPHFTTLQKFTDRINNSLFEKIISSFIVISGTKHIFVGIDSTGFKVMLRNTILNEQDLEESMRSYLLGLTYCSKLYVQLR
jgi:Transposase domain (DUF772)